jgi:hypothetical protein
MKLSGKLPPGAGNGLFTIAQDLVDRPRDRHWVVALIDCKSTTTENDTGEVVPTARIRRIEVVAPDDRNRAAELAMRATERRSTGIDPLPFNAETGEIL